MIDILKTLLVVFISFSGGVVISSAVFAFIAAIGIIPSIISKTNTSKYIILYEEIIIFGGIFGCLCGVFDINIIIGQFLLGKIFIMLFSLAIGVFIGVLASSLAEVVDVIPIFSKRINIKKNVELIMISLAIGKLIGSIIYFLNTSFQV